MTKARVVLALLCASLALSCFAQQASFSGPGISNFDSRALFRETRQMRRLIIDEELRRAPTAVEWTLVTGLAYSNDGDGTRIYGFPSEIQANINEGSSIVSFGYDFYDRVETDGKTQSGHGDPSVTFLHRLYKKGPQKVVVGAGVSVPGGSDLGASHAGQLLIGAYSYHFTPQTWGKISATFTHANGAPASVDSWGQGGKLFFEHDFVDESDVWISVSRTYRRGAGGGSSLSFGYDTPLVRQPWGVFKGLFGSISGSCGISSGGRCDSIQFDLSMPFN